MNGGYVMINYDASQAELAKAYATNKPVIAYDENGKAYYASIILDGSTYLLIEKGNKKFIHYCFFTYLSANVCIEIINNSNDNLTGKDITDFIQSLPANAIYPVKNVEFKKLTSPDREVLVCGLKNYTSGGAKFAYVLINLLSFLYS